jgi:hypothetical protein
VPRANGRNKCGMTILYTESSINRGRYESLKIPWHDQCELSTTCSSTRAESPYATLSEPAPNIRCHRVARHGSNLPRKLIEAGDPFQSQLLSICVGLFSELTKPVCGSQSRHSFFPLAHHRLLFLGATNSSHSLHNTLYSPLSSISISSCAARSSHSLHSSLLSRPLSWALSTPRPPKLQVEATIITSRLA